MTENELVMPVARRPFLAYRHESHAPDVFVALLFPVSAGVWMAVQSLPEPIYKALHFGSRPRPLVGWKAYPHRSTIQLRLDVCLFGVSDFREMIPLRPVGIGDTRSLQRRR
eukprot:12796383-Alexandrium_andersonii.AAC.1